MFPEDVAGRAEHGLREIAGEAVAPGLQDRLIVDVVQVTVPAISAR